MRLIALKDLPNRVKAGESFEETDARARVLLQLALVREDRAVQPPAPRRSYRRRDLAAEDSPE